MSTVVRLCCPQCFPLTHTDTQRQVGVHAEPQTHTWAEAGRGVNTARIWFRLKTCLIQTLRLYFPLSYLLTHTDVNTHTYTGTQTCSSDLLRFTMATSRGTTLCCSGIIIFGGGGDYRTILGFFFSVRQLSHRFDSLWSFHQRAFEQDNVVPDSWQPHLYQARFKHGFELCVCDWINVAYSDDPEEFSRWDNRTRMGRLAEKVSAGNNKVIR